MTSIVSNVPLGCSIGSFEVLSSTSVPFNHDRGPVATKNQADVQANNRKASDSVSASARAKAVGGSKEK